MTCFDPLIRLSVICYPLLPIEKVIEYAATVSALQKSFLETLLECGVVEIQESPASRTRL